MQALRKKDAIWVFVLKATLYEIMKMCFVCLFRAQPLHRSFSEFEFSGWQSFNSKQSNAE